jgi:hypothetical protein
LKLFKDFLRPPLDAQPARQMPSMAKPRSMQPLIATQIRVMPSSEPDLPASPVR